jgi:plastocyanin
VSHSVRGAARTAVVAAAAVLPLGCSGSKPASTGPATSDPSSTDTVQSVTIRATDAFRFDPSQVTVHQGRVRLTLVDTGSYPHNLVLPALHAKTADISGSPGEQRTTLTLDVAPGTYNFFCSYHSSAGMTGRLVVRRH